MKTPSQPQGFTFRSLFIENIGIKLVSLSVAVALAVYVRGEKTALSEFKVKVQYLFDSRLLTSTPQGEITVRLKGAENLLNNLNEEGLAPLKVDLSEYDSGQLCFKFRSDELPIGYRSLQVEEILPKCVPLTLEKKVEKEVPVRADIVGTPEEGYSLGESSVSTPTVVIQGAESAVAQVRQVQTEPVSVSGAKADIKRTIPLLPFPDGSHVSYKNGAPPEVEVGVAIIPQKVEKTIRNVKIVATPSPEEANYKLLTEQIDVVLYGPKPILEALDANTLKIEMSLLDSLKSAAPKVITTVRADTTQVMGLPSDVVPVSFRPNAEIKLYLMEAPKPEKP